MTILGCGTKNIETRPAFDPLMKIKSGFLLWDYQQRADFIKYYFDAEASNKLVITPERFSISLNSGELCYSTESNINRTLRAAEKAGSIVLKIVEFFQK